MEPDRAVVMDAASVTSISFPKNDGDDGNNNQLNCICGVVCGFSEMHELNPVAENGPCLYMWMNEEPPAGAKINELASNLFENLNKEKICIRGPVIITGRGNEDGNLVSLTKSEIDFFLNFAPTPLALL